MMFMMTPAMPVWATGRQDLTPMGPSVQEQLARTDRLNQFNTTAFVIHMLYGPDFGRMRFKKYLTYFRPSGNFMAGYKFASRSKACLAYIRAHEERRGEAS